MSTETKCNILLFALILSLGLNIYEVLRDSGLSYCDDDGRYPLLEGQGGGADIKYDDAKKLVDTYRENHKTQFSGVVFSKHVLEEIFSDVTKNSFSIDLVELPDKSINAIICGQKSDNTLISDTYNSRIFIAQTLCPSDCIVWP
jgi:hypothetical protein